MNDSEETLLQTEDVRVRVMPLPVGAETPWHTHSVITDHMVCLTGQIRVCLRQPVASYDLQPGERCLVVVGRPHQVCNSSDTPASYLLIQGVGVYDFNRLESP